MPGLRDDTWQRASVAAVIGVHDVYLVFRSNGAAVIDSFYVRVSAGAGVPISAGEPRRYRPSK